MSFLVPAEFPKGFSNEEALEEFMTLPSQALVEDMKSVAGDLMILGVGGKMGPTLARLAKRAAPEKRVVGVSRFSVPEVRNKLEAIGVETIACDLLDREAVRRLPGLPNIIFMAGRKFGTSANQALTWAMNTHVPAIVGEVFQEARIVCFSTACVYPYVSVLHQGATEHTPALPPPGEYANSCLGRERILEYFSDRHGTPGRLIRLSYAIDMRYGVLHDVARKVLAGEAIDLTVGHANVIWQGDANAQALRSLLHCTTPTTPLNVSGPEVMSIHATATEFGRLFGRDPVFGGTEGGEAWLVNTGLAAGLFGYPLVSAQTMIAWTADWIGNSRGSLNLDTHYEAHDGNF